MQKRKIAVIVGSESDLPKIAEGISVLRVAEAGGYVEIVPIGVDVCSAHRNPKELRDLLCECTTKGVDVIIACAGKLAALFGTIDSELRNVLKNDRLHVIAVPLKGSTKESTQAAILSAKEVPNAQFIFKDEFFEKPVSAFEYAVKGELPKIIIEEQKRPKYFTLKEVYEMTRVKHPAMVAYAHIIGLLEMCGMIHISTGKTREMFANPKYPELRYILATDRISIFDIVLEALILNKGAVLTAMTVFWLKKVFKDIPNHLVAYGNGIFEFLSRDAIWKLMGKDGMEYLMKNMIVVKKAEVIKVEAIVRGYLTGSGLKDYKKNSKVCGIQLPEGLVDGSKLPENIFTPSTKADYGDHDENISFEKAVELVGFEKMAYVRDKSLEIYARSAEEAAKVGIIIADTKVEFGVLPNGNSILIDEVLTPDSSRFWPKDGLLRAMEKKETPPSMDKQPVRNAGEKAGIKSGRMWIPSVDLCAETSDNYMQIFNLLAGESLEDFWIGEMNI